MRLSAIGLIITLALSLCMLPYAIDAQQPVKIPLIGMLADGAYPSEAEWQQSLFQQKLRELGWHEGHNITFERRFADGKLDRLPALAAELVRLRPDVIVTGGTQAVQAVQQATTAIPIVITGAGTLVESGIVTSRRILVATSQDWKTRLSGYQANAWSS